ncbi:MAG: hypothetical protein ACE5G5_05510, partial [Candidatus Methylomirabilales bacterium]
AVFGGPVDFGSADIAGQFAATAAQFKNPEHVANFNSMKVGGTAVFHRAVFGGPVDFGSADIAGQFIIDEAQFTNTEQRATFHNMKVGSTAILHKAAFAGPADFIGADIAGHFVAIEAQFTNAEQRANFNRIKVSGTAVFRKTAFAGPVSMADAAFLDLFILGPQGDPSRLPRLDLSRTVITRELRMVDLTLQDMVVTSLQVAGPTSLERLTIERKANVEHSSFLTLALSEVSWPRTSDSVQLDGMSYQHISTGSELDSWKELINLVDQAAYNASVYATLEAFFQERGYPERADAVFVAQKRRERREVLRGLPWTWNLLLDILVRHGRSPSRAFGWGALFVIIGCLVFRRKEDMELENDEAGSFHYNAFWYSLDLFLPFIDLKAASVWIPKQDRRFARHYMRVHTILGWILIPIGLAALTGIIK